MCWHVEVGEGRLIPHLGLQFREQAQCDVALVGIASAAQVAAAGAAASIGTAATVCAAIALPVPAAMAPPALGHVAQPVVTTPLQHRNPPTPPPPHSLHPGTPP